MKLWRLPNEEMHHQKPILVVHGDRFKTVSEGYKHQLRPILDNMLAWCYREDLIASAEEAVEKTAGKLGIKL